MAATETKSMILENELDWLDATMAERFAVYGGQVPLSRRPPRPPPLPTHDADPYAKVVRNLTLSAPERLILVLALAPYVKPALLDPFLLQNQATGRRFTEFGGAQGQSHGGFLPTAETALFLLGGDNLAERVGYEQLLDPGMPLRRSGLVQLDQRHPEEPPLAAALRMTQAGLHSLLRGDSYDPPPSADFPASRLTTPLEWADLVLDEATRDQINQIMQWVSHSKTLLEDWGLARRLKPGFRTLFYGPPGTGKTLTAALLGKASGLAVYRVDLSRVVSKWIGETEKNLASLFDQAEHRNWILFFDEADALFGKRGEASSANDRAANQQIAYLLQRLEDYPGLAILATNLRSNLDEAFARRFQSSVLFSMPSMSAREQLWRDTFASPGFKLAHDVRFEQLAEKYEMAGGAIINVLRYAALRAVQRDPAVVHAKDLIEGIRLEMQKDRRYVSA